MWLAEGERKTPTAVLNIPDEEVLVVISLSQQMLESPCDVMREDMRSCWSCWVASQSRYRSGSFQARSWQFCHPSKEIFLRRETTEARVKLLNSHAIRPEGGQLHGGNVLAKVVVLQRFQACEPIGKEVPYSFGLVPHMPNTTSFWTTKLRG